jgi:pimeloyl-ACP methyl ester carboxylesterase
LISHTVAPIIHWPFYRERSAKFSRPVPPTFKNQFPASLMLRPKQLRAAAEESALLIATAAQFQALYPSIGCEVRIFHGTEDEVIEPKQARDLHQVLDRSDLHLVPNAGYMVTYADTAAIARAVSSLGTATED